MTLVRYKGRLIRIARPAQPIRKNPKQSNTGLIVGGVALAGAGLAAYYLITTSSGTGSSQQCVYDDQCSSGQICENGYCVSTGSTGQASTGSSCTSTDQCGTGQACVDGTCQNCGACSSECLDGPCPSCGQYCDSGVCKTRTCAKTDDCPPGCTCVNGVCSSAVIPPTSPTLTADGESSASVSGCDTSVTFLVSSAGPGDHLILQTSSGTQMASFDANASGFGTYKLIFVNYPNSPFGGQTLQYVLNIYDFTTGLTSNNVTITVSSCSSSGGDPCAQYGCGKDAACPTGCECVTTGKGTVGCRTPAASPAYAVGVVSV